MRYWFTCLGVAMLATPIFAQQSPRQPAPATKQIAPFVDESTFLVVHVDASRLDVAAIIHGIGQWASIDRNEQQRMITFMQTALKTFQKAGGGRFYFGMSLADGWTEPFLIVPVGREVMLKVVQGLLSQPFRNASAVLHRQAIIVGSRRSVKRIHSLKANLPKAFAAEFASKELSPVQGVLWIPPVLRKALNEAAPGLPGVAIGEAAKPLFEGWSRISFALNTKPKLQLRLVVHAHDEQTAERITKALGAVLVQLRNNPQVRREFGDFGKLIPLLRPQVNDKQLRWSFDEQALAKIITPMLSRQRQAAKRINTHNQLRKIALAMHNYLEANKIFPASASYDANGKALLSWRVHLLPYLEQNELYKQFKLNEPWNSPHNKKLIAQMPKVFQTSNKKLNGAFKTRFLVPVGKSAIFFGQQGTPIANIIDGTSNTILTVQASEEQAVPWTKPSDLSMKTKNLRAALFGPKGKSFMAAAADGSSHVIPSKIGDNTLRALFTRNGGEVVNFP